MNRTWIKHSADKSSWPGVKTQQIVTVDGSVASPVDTPFDKAIRDNLGPGDIVYVGPGTFLTKGACGNSLPQTGSPGFRMQSGSSLIGSGSTVLKLESANDSFGGVVVASSQFDGTNLNQHHDILVADLDIDCNAPAITAAKPTAPWYLQGVQLFSAGGCQIRRVRVTNACAMGENNLAPKTECFVLCINTSKGASVGNVISGCSVYNFYNPTGLGCCSAISMNCWDNGTISGEMSDCDVTLNGGGGEFAFNGSNMTDTLITRCKSRGASRGFCNDTWPNWNLHIIGCLFDLPGSSCVGILLTRDNQNSVFAYNEIIIRGANACGFLVENANPNGSCILIKDNTIVGVGAWQGPAYGLNLNSNLDPKLVPSKVCIMNNSVKPDIGRIDILANASVGFQDGNDFEGATWLWPVPQPNDGWKPDVIGS